MTVSLAPVDGPVWNLERRGSSGDLFWASETSKVKFRCEVEVKEYVTDPNEHRIDYMQEKKNGGTIDGGIYFSISFCATCVAAVAVTVFLPWLLITSTTT